MKLNDSTKGKIDILTYCIKKVSDLKNYKEINVLKYSTELKQNL